MNVDENPQTPSTYGIRGIPTLILFKEGKTVNQVVGAVRKSRLRAMIEELAQQGFLHFREGGKSYGRDHHSL